MRRTPVASLLNLLGPRSSDFGFTRLQTEAAELRAFLSVCLVTLGSLLAIYPDGIFLLQHRPSLCLYSLLAP